MRNLFDQLVKRIAARAVGPSGLLRVEHEIAPDAQTLDVWFEPDPARAEGRMRSGALGRMMAVPSILEAFHNTPDLDDVRGCIHKQLGLDRMRLAEARREGHSRPPFPHLWILSAGRAVGVIAAYCLSPLPGFPEGFWGRSAADALGVVVLRDLPRSHETLLLRLMGAGGVLRDAIADLIELPPGAWEREVAMAELIALRFEIPQASPTHDEREYMMSADELLEHLKQEYRNEGVERGLKEALLTLYRSRFGELPREIAAAVEGMHDVGTLNRWVAMIGGASRPDVVLSLVTGRPSRA